MKKRISILAALLLLGMLFTACGENGLTDPMSTDTAQVSFNVTVASQTRALVNIGTLVTSGTIRLARGAMVRYVNLAIAGSYASAVVPNLLVGNWHADVQLYDADGLIIYSGSADFTIYNGTTTQIIELALVRHQGTALFGFELPTETTDSLILWNKLGSLAELGNGACGPALLPGTGTTFAAGKWGNGVNCGSGTTQANAVRIPGGTIPMSDFSIEFWYTKTSDFSPDNIAVLFDALNTTPGARERLTLSIRSPWTPTGGSGSYYCILFGVQTSHTEDIMVYAYHDFEDLAALNAAFPLNTPVHIAVTKRNSDGRLRIFINGTALSTTYIKLAPFFTDDTSVIANVEGNFSSDLYIGNIKPGYNSTPAKGIIDNMKIYNQEMNAFFITAE